MIRCVDQHAGFEAPALTLRHRHRYEKQVDSGASVSRDSVATSSSDHSAMSPRHESDHEPAANFYSNDIGEEILRMIVPYKHASNVDPVILEQGMRAIPWVITDRPLIGHQMPDARIQLKHGSAFLSISNDRKAKELRLSVFDPARCAHPLFQKQELRQSDMTQIHGALSRILDEVDCRIFGNRTMAAQESEPLAQIAYEKKMAI